MVTLGHLYPGKGVEEVIDAVAAAQRDPRLEGRPVEVVNLGGAAAGHEDLVTALTARARSAGVSWRSTGWVPDAELAGWLDDADVPVAAHRHLSASGSIATWMGAGRRPVVLRSRYAEELAARSPGTLLLTAPTDLSRTIADELAAVVTGRSRTWWPAGQEPGPSWSQVARELLEVATRPAVSVVIPYYRDQEMLDLLLDRLSAQTGVVGGLEVVVADDGSPQPPLLPEPDGAIVGVRLVRQVDLGFRAAAARNLGLRVTAGRVVVLLDGDTVPEDGYVAALQQVCTGAPTLAVGRRRHAHLRGRPWPPAEELPDPAWLREGYAATHDLRHADDASFRFVISAVLALSRTVLDAVGGFDETLEGYGGEDWELAWRGWLAGTDLCHVPEAVAWHDGPDLAGRVEEGPGRAHQGRAGLAEVKNAESARLAPRLPHPLVRGRGWTHAQPDIVAVLDAAGCSAGQLTCSVESLLRLGDVGVWLAPGATARGAAAQETAEQHGPALGAEQLAQDPRVHVGHPPSAVLARCRALVEVTRPVAVLALPWDPFPLDLSGVGTGAGRLVDDPVSGVRVRVTRHLGRELLHGDQGPPRWLRHDLVEAVPVDVVVEDWRRRHL